MTLILTLIVQIATGYMEAHNLPGSLLLWSLLLVHLIFTFCSGNSLHSHIVICMTLLTFCSFFSCLCVLMCVGTCVGTRMWRLRLASGVFLFLFIWTGYPTEPSAHDHGSFSYSVCSENPSLSSKHWNDRQAGPLPTWQLRCLGI